MRILHHTRPMSACRFVYILFALCFPLSRSDIKMILLLPGSFAPQSSAIWVFIMPLFTQKCTDATTQLIAFTSRRKLYICPNFKLELSSLLFSRLSLEEFRNGIVLRKSCEIFFSKRKSRCVAIPLQPLLQQRACYGVSFLRRLKEVSLL